MSFYAKSALYLLVLMLVFPTEGYATVAPRPAVGPGGVVLKALARFFGKESIEEASEQLAKLGGRELFERSAKKIAAEGGEALEKRAAAMAFKHGPEVLRAIDNSPIRSKTIFNALDEIPSEQVASASRRIAAGKEGVEVANAVGKYGSNALRTELAHPGMGTKLIRAFGNDGTEMVVGLSDDYATSLARHADDLAVLPPTQRSSLLELIKKDKDAFFSWLDKFVSKNPGKIVFSTATAATLIATPELLLEEVTEYGPDGEIIQRTKTGPVNGPVEEIGIAIANPMKNTLNGLGLVLVLAVGAFASIKLWDTWRKTQSRDRESDSGG